jgi:hypothetical protein
VAEMSQPQPKCNYGHMDCILVVAVTVCAVLNFQPQDFTIHFPEAQATILVKVLSVLVPPQCRGWTLEG